MAEQNRRWGHNLSALGFHLLLALLLGLIAWASLRYDRVADWTELSRNSLHPASIKMLERLQSPLHFTSFAPEDPVLRARISEVIDRYRRYRPDISLEFVNPTLEPARVRELDIQLAGELLIEYQGRQEKLQDLTEQRLSNAIQRLMLSSDDWIVELQGHGERSLSGRANFDLGLLGAELRRKGNRLQPIFLAESLQVPDNSTLLLIASPQTPMLQGELTAVLSFLEKGGNLLWLSDPGSQRPPQLLSYLGLDFLPGTLVDASAAELGLDQPTFALVHRYPQHPTTRGLKLPALFPLASALKQTADSDWQATAILQTLERAWNETGELTGELQRDPDRGELAGPLAIGYALQRPRQDGRQQRVVVISDADFLSNAYLGNGANRTLGSNLVRWLSEQDQLLQIPPVVANDLSLQFSRLQGAVVGLGFLIILPLVLLMAGILIWWYRERVGTK